jgi:hypothetical protein
MMPLAPPGSAGSITRAVCRLPGEYDEGRRATFAAVMTEPAAKRVFRSDLNALRLSSATVLLVVLAIGTMG